MLHPRACLLWSLTWAGMLCVPSGSWQTLCPDTVTWDGAGMLCVSDGKGETPCPSLVPLVHRHLCQDGARMLHVPNWNRGTQHRASCALSPATSQGWDAPCSQRELGDPAPQGRATCTPSPRRAGMLRIPAGPLCPGSCPRSVCNQPRSRVRPGPVPAPAWKRGSGSAGSQSRGAQPGERPRERERGGGPCPARSWGTRHPWGHGDTAPPWPGCSSSCSSRLWAARPSRAGGRRRGTMEQTVTPAPRDPLPAWDPLPTGVWARGRA